MAVIKGYVKSARVKADMGSIIREIYNDKRAFENKMESAFDWAFRGDEIEFKKAKIKSVNETAGGFTIEGIITIETALDKDSLAELLDDKHYDFAENITDDGHLVYEGYSIDDTDYGYDEDDENSYGLTVTSGGFSNFGGSWGKTIKQTKSGKVNTYEVDVWYDADWERF